jgi:voltage-gated potassium channel
MALKKRVLAAAGTMTRHVQLLAALVATEIARPLLVKENFGARIASVALFAIVGIAVFRSVFDTQSRRRLGALLSLLTITIGVAAALSPTSWHQTMEVLSNLATAAFFVLVLSVIIRHVFGARHLKIDDVVGAFSGYIIIALIWGRLYAVAWILVPHYYSISPDIAWELNNWISIHTLFDFYSFCNITTIGYGDITTTGPPTNALVWMEVMCGQFYLAVVVATIVGIKMSQAMASPRDGP